MGERAALEFLSGELRGKELWTAHQYVSIPMGDRGKSRIPTLKVTEDGTARDATTNEEKSTALCHIFFPQKTHRGYYPL